MYKLAITHARVMRHTFALMVYLDDKQATLVHSAKCARLFKFAFLLAVLHSVPTASQADVSLLIIYVYIQHEIIQLNHFNRPNLPIAVSSARLANIAHGASRSSSFFMSPDRSSTVPIRRIAGRPLVYPAFYRIAFIINTLPLCIQQTRMRAMMRKLRRVLP